LEGLRGNLTKELAGKEKEEELEMFTDGMYMPTNVQTGVIQMGGANSFAAFHCWSYWDLVWELKDEGT
jgi:hypothetical protein